MSNKKLIKEKNKCDYLKNVENRIEEYYLFYKTRINDFKKDINFLHEQ